jgi:hypothetical protein
MTIYLNVMNSKSVLLLGYILNLCLFASASAQTAENDDQQCNRKTVDNGWRKILPRGICIPKGDYYINFVEPNIDFNKDDKLDVVVRYLESPPQIGTIISYGIYFRSSDTTFIEKMLLSNLVPPFIGNLQAASLSSDSIKLSMINMYPYDTEVLFNKDTIEISHLIPDDFGKTYYFVYNVLKDNWYLENIQYWAGNLDRAYLERLDLSEKLLGKVHLENKRPNTPLSIGEFNLIESKRIAETEESPYLMNKYDIFELGAKKQK